MAAQRGVCIACGTPLNRYNKELLCGACETRHDSGAEAVADTAPGESEAFGDKADEVDRVPVKV